MPVDLALLPPPEIIEPLSFESILAEHKADLISRYPDIEATIDLESEPALKLLEVGAYRELKLRARYNDEARALLLAFGVGADLDHIGATYYQEERLVVTPANPATTPPTEIVMESDDDYRYRLSLKPESYSVAGPRDAFKFHALSADGAVKDASVTSPMRGTTEVFILSHIANGTPDPALIATVDSALNAESIRPLSEDVIVTAGSIVNYTLDIDLTLFPGATGEVALAAAQNALAAYATASHRLGTDIIRSAIDARAHVAGVKEVVINQPAANLVCSQGQAPYCTAIAVRIAGVEA